MKPRHETEVIINPSYYEPDALQLQNTFGGHIISTEGPLRAAF